jgi:hypothetical protein
VTSLRLESKRIGRRASLEYGARSKSVREVCKGGKARVREFER